MSIDTELLKKLKNPKLKNSAFKELFDLYQERLYWHVRKIVITHDNANDVLQNTFIRIYNGIANFKEQSSLHTWMYRIAYNESIRFLEQQKHKIGFSIHNENENYINLLKEDPYFNGDDAQLKLHSVLSGLPEKQQKIFQMKYFDDLTFREISEIINVSENTIKSSYYTAVKTIEEQIITL